MPQKKRIFFDTSVCIDVARSTIPEQEWGEVSNFLRKTYKYCISPLTGYELIAGLDSGTPAFFSQNKRALRILYPPGKKEILPALKSFVPFHLFGELRKPHRSTPNLDLWIRLVINAKDRTALEGGKMQIGAARRRLGIDLQGINKQIRNVENGYAQYFRRFCDLNVPDLTPEIWADFVLREYSPEFRLTHRESVAIRTDAAYRFSLAMWRHAKDPQYNIQKHRSELVDAQQLYYLCDDNMVFVTSEIRLKNKIRGSSQADRILTYDEAKRLTFS